LDKNNMMMTVLPAFLLGTDFSKVKFIKIKESIHSFAILRVIR